MRKKLLHSVSFIFFFLLLIGVFAIPLFAADDTVGTPSAGIVSDYTLPYPGILPDNPLYVLKTMRDKLISVLISDPKDKAQFDLLQADKRLSGAFAMSKEPNRNEDLIVSTISKGENYFSDSVGQVQLARKEGIEVNGLMDQLENAAKKHEQIIRDLQNSFSKKDSEQLALEAQRVEQFAAQVRKIRSQK